MTDTGTLLDNFPSRRFDIEELDELESAERFRAIVYPDAAIEVDGQDAMVDTVVFVTDTSLAGAIYDEAEEAWYRVYSQPLEEAAMTDAYDAIREFWEETALFERTPRSVSEAVYTVEIPSGTESAGYEPGDPFDCPVCSETHTVQFFEDEEVAAVTDLDSSTLYVDCDHAQGGRLHVEYQARTTA